mgnify:CR=1 FL=1
MKKIPLRNRNSRIVGWALIDDSDYEWVMQWRWCLGGSRNKYARRRGFYLHRVLLGVTSLELEVDHKDGNTLNCQRSNLRTIPHNAQPQNVSGHGKSKFRGVHWIKERGKWRASVGHDKKKTFLGYFDDEVEAGKVAAAFRAKVLPYSREALEIP